MRLKMGYIMKNKAIRTIYKKLSNENYVYMPYEIKQCNKN